MFQRRLRHLRNIAARNIVNRYKHNGESLYFCSPQCADKWAADHNAEADHIQLTITDREPYNGAAYGYSPYDLMDFECRSCYEQGGAGGYPDPEDYDCCDDAEDYGEEEMDDED